MAIPSHGLPLDAIQRIADTPDRRLAWTFFIFFSRFEYALKRDSRYLASNSPNAKPNWDRFASENDKGFTPGTSGALREAVNYYLAHPPRKQLQNNGVATWSEPQSWDKNEPQFLWLLRALRVTRNNLFHGGKPSLLNTTAEASRDRELLGHSLCILSSALELDSELRRLFLDELE